MPSFARDDMPPSICRNERRDAKPGAGTQHQLHPLARRRVMTQSADMGSGKPWQRPGDGLEIVDNVQLRKAEAGGEFRAPEAPCAVGKNNLLALYWPGDGQYRHVWAS